MQKKHHELITGVAGLRDDLCRANSKETLGSLSCVRGIHRLMTVRTSSRARIRSPKKCINLNLLRLLLMLPDY